MSRTVSRFVLGLLAAAAVVLTGRPASAHVVPQPCDFVTGGGFVFSDSGARVNFGAHGGCKNEGFFGHVNVVDRSFGNPPYHIRSTSITGYFTFFGPPATGTDRDICGTFVDNLGNSGHFRARMVDNGEPGINDKFGIKLTTGYNLTPRLLGGGGPGGGNIQLHKPNPSTTPPSPPPTEAAACGGLTAEPLDP